MLNVNKTETQYRCSEDDAIKVHWNIFRLLYDAFKSIIVWVFWVAGSDDDVVTTSDIEFRVTVRLIHFQLCFWKFKVAWALHSDHKFNIPVTYTAEKRREVSSAEQSCSYMFTTNTKYITRQNCFVGYRYKNKNGRIKNSKL